MQRFVTSSPDGPLPSPSLSRSDLAGQRVTAQKTWRVGNTGSTLRVSTWMKSWQYPLTPSPEDLISASGDISHTVHGLTHRDNLGKSRCYELQICGNMLEQPEETNTRTNLSEDHYHFLEGNSTTKQLYTQTQDPEICGKKDQSYPSRQDS